nr:MAG: ribosome silencing factor [Pseudomonadota bacterium]
MKKRAKAARPGARARTAAPRPAQRAQAGGADAKKMALLVAEAGLDKKATEIEIIDVTGKVDYADYLVLMTGNSDRHVAAIAEAVDSSLAKQGYRSISIEGLPRGEWVLIDFVDVVVHVFQERSRALYDLDGLWMDARRVEVPQAHGGRV